MKWTTTKSQYPVNEQEVFICVDGMVYDAVFNEPEKCFVLKNSTIPSISTLDKLIFWKDKTEE